MTDSVASTLAAVAHALPGGGEDRDGQRRMAEAVGRAMAEGRHLVAQAGTGTGKSLAYLIPAAMSGERVVVATATKALQDQLADRDLPLVAEALEHPFSFAVLKGRSNYLCRQRVAEIGGQGRQLSLGAAGADPPDADDPVRRPAAEDVADGPDMDGPDPSGRLVEQVRRLIRWGGDTTTGDRAELDFEPGFRAWTLVSTRARECPGAFRCPSGGDCFAEGARTKAADADVVVVNTHLYGAHLASGGAVLPEHGVVVFDEAHELESVMTDTLGVEIGPGRFRALASAARASLDPAVAGTTTTLDGVAALADVLHRVLRPLAGRRLPAGDVQPEGMPVAPAGSDTDPRPGPAPADAATGSATATATDASRDNDPSVGQLLELARGRVGRLTDLLRQAERQAGTGEPAADRSRRDRVLLAAGHLSSDLARLAALSEDEVVWVDDDARAASLRVSPIDVGPVLSERLWSEVTGVLTSATVPVGLASRLGLPGDGSDDIDVGSPFDYRAHALLYVARSLPDRRRPESEPALHDELEALIRAAGGRTLALFTSWRAMRAAVEALRNRLPVPVLAQSDLPKPLLVETFRQSEPTCLFATLGFWQGVDVPGPTCSLVTIDRIPFPRPDEPVLEARRERAGSRAFSEVDLPRAGTLLAQGAGRLIRSADDRGVVAVLDSRLATASYRATLLARVPPMRRTVDRAEVEQLLASIADPECGTNSLPG